MVAEILSSVPIVSMVTDWLLPRVTKITFPENAWLST